MGALSCAIVAFSCYRKNVRSYAVRSVAAHTPSLPFSATSIFSSQIFCHLSPQGPLLPTSLVLSTISSLLFIITNSISHYTATPFELWVPFSPLLCAILWRVVEGTILSSQRELDELKRMYLSAAPPAPRAMTGRAGVGGTHVDTRHSKVERLKERLSQD